MLPLACCVTLEEIIFSLSGFKFTRLPNILDDLLEGFSVLTPDSVYIFKPVEDTQNIQRQKLMENQIYKRLFR